MAVFKTPRLLPCKRKNHSTTFVRRNVPIKMNVFIYIILIFSGIILVYPMLLTLGVIISDIDERVGNIIAYLWKKRQDHSWNKFQKLQKHNHEKTTEES